jgi:hypothetical protein
MSGSGLVYKTRVANDDDDSAGSRVVRKTRVETRVTDDDDDADLSAAASAYATSKTTAADPWWRWVERYCEYRASHLTEVLGQCFGEFRAQAREHCEREVGIVKRELEQQRRELTVWLREQVLECGRALREEARAVCEQQEQEDAVTRYELGVVRRELVTLREEVALERGFQALKAEIAAAESEIPKIPAIEARIDTEHAKLKREQARLERELTKTKERLSKMRVDQSIADYRLSEHLREQPAPGVELKFETASTSFAVKDLDPNAAAAWREFVAGVLDAQQDAATSMSISDAGRVIALPLRRHDAA